MVNKFLGLHASLPRLSIPNLSDNISERCNGIIYNNALPIFFNIYTKGNIMKPKLLTTEYNIICNLNLSLGFVFINIIYKNANIPITISVQST